MVERIGILYGIPVYYDEQQCGNKFLIGHKGGSEADLDFIIGDTRDLEQYKKALNLYYEKLSA